MRRIPPALAAHLQLDATTTCSLLRIQLRSGEVIGLASLDRDVVYDDGDGEVTYRATIGFDPSMLSADIAYSVDNAEGYALTAEDVEGITVERVNAGELDDAQWAMYLVNYEDTSQGHVVLDAGDVGEVRTLQDLVWIPELLSYAMRLRQPVGHVWQRTCRATFGSPADSQTGCGFDAEALWAEGEVLAAGVEPDREFHGDLITSSNWPTTPMPGRLEWLTGKNVGRQYSIERFEADSDSAVVVLHEPMPYPIEAGDTYRIRPDCGKRYAEDCVAIWDNGVNFKGEPLIPVGDAVALQIAGAQISRGGGFAGEVRDLLEQIEGSDLIQE